MKGRILSLAVLMSVGVCSADAVQPPSTQLGPLRSLASTAFDRTKPVKDAHLLSCTGFGGTDVNEMWGRSEVVVDAVVMETIPADEAVPGEPPQTLIATTYKLDVVETFKADGHWKAGQKTLLVTRIGGVRDRGDHILRKFDPKFPLFEKGERYVLFLEHLRRDEYAPAFGPDSALLVTAVRLEPRGKSAISARLGSLSFDALRNMLLTLNRK